MKSELSETNAATSGAAKPPLTCSSGAEGGIRTRDPHPSQGGGFRPRGWRYFPGLLSCLRGFQLVQLFRGCSRAL
jgi:hypothetical protein